MDFTLKDWNLMLEFTSNSEECKKEARFDKASQSSYSVSDAVLGKE